MRFCVETPFEPSGDQPKAIQALVDGLAEGKRAQTLLGITGSGKTYTIAKVIERVQRPTLIIAHNKTLAAQLYNEFKEIFPNNAVEYFVSYYDYYQPEAYVPSTNTFIEKDSAINDMIDRMRLSSTHSLLTRDDVIIIASVSCIYGLGTAEAYASMKVSARRGQVLERDDFLRQLVHIQYTRNDYHFDRGTFRVRGDSVDIYPAYLEDTALRVIFWGDEVERVEQIDPTKGFVTAELDKMTVFPASHYVVTEEAKQRACQSIRAELETRLNELNAEERFEVADRLRDRTINDIEMIATLGFCSGIENYSRHLSGRRPGDPPPCLINYFPEDFLLVIDESHVTVPQIGGMFRADRSRKQTLVEYGFRLPSALDNRPLNFEEFNALVQQAIYVSATPGDYEIEQSEGEIVEQIIRPTGLLDPLIEIRPAQAQVDDALAEIQEVVKQGSRILVTTLTKRMAEDLTDYLADLDLKVGYIHSDVDTLERSKILRDLRLGTIDILVGINLLREGLDLPEVKLVIILDADKEGFLRSRRSLIQTMGRASRNAEGRVILYADRITHSIDEAVSETRRRREMQMAYNRTHGITPQTIIKGIRDIEKHIPNPKSEQPAHDDATIATDEIEARIEVLNAQMKALAKKLEFEEAAKIRDRILALRRRLEN